VRPVKKRRNLDRPKGSALERVRTEWNSLTHVRVEIGQHNGGSGYVLTSLLLACTSSLYLAWLGTGLRPQKYRRKLLRTAEVQTGYASQCPTNTNVTTRRELFIPLQNDKTVRARDGEYLKAY